MLTIVIIGGGAAGLFAAITAAEHSPLARVVVLEKTQQLLAKVRISGGGRCNVTHAAFCPKKLVQNYPRGHKELLGPFHRFQPRDTIDWFEKRGVPLKTEADGRIFPVSDNAESIIQCLLQAAKELGIEICKGQKILSIEHKEAQFHLLMEGAPPLIADRLLLATGSSPQGHLFAASLGHTLIPPIPSLFTFNVPSSPLLDLPGIALPRVKLQIKETGHVQEGPLLLTHWGFSGPAALKLSAWAAKELHEKNYQVSLIITWLPHLSEENLFQQLTALKTQKPSYPLEHFPISPIPTQLWKRLVQLAGISENTPLSRLPHSSLRQFARLCLAHAFKVEGKTLYKQEFVTCGGVALQEVDFQTMGSRRTPHLYFAGEILNIDGITGGFNFQNAWTSGWIAGKSMASS